MRPMLAATPHTLRSSVPLYHFAPRSPGGRLKGLAIVLALHALLGAAVVWGWADQAVHTVKKPLDAVVIQKVTIPPPTMAPPLPPPLPPPPRPPLQILPQPVLQLQTVKTLNPPASKLPATVPTGVAPADDVPAPAAVAIPPNLGVPALPAEPALAAPSSTVLVAAPPVLTSKAYNRNDMSVACPTQTKPEMPSRAIAQGISGVVKAQALVKNGVVKEVTILSGPRIFHTAVRNAMLQYQCVSDGIDTIATQEFSFKLE